MNFSILLHAHDHLWRDRRFPLRDRIDACAILLRLAIAANGSVKISECPLNEEAEHGE